MRIFSLLLFFIFPSLLWADQLIIEPDMGRKPILSALENSHYSLNLVMYGFTDQQLLNAILKQTTKNIAVKIILEQHPYKRENENNKIITLFAKNNIPWHGNIPGINLIHQKTLLIDNQKAIVMTFNFTQSAFKKDRNFALVIDNPKQVRQIAAVFSADWNHVPSNIDAMDLIYSPMSRNKLISLILHAKHRLNIYAQSVSDYHLVGVLAKMARKGVSVNILTSNKIRKQQALYLQNAGVTIHYSKQYYIHAKVMIIDNQKAILGSINLTRPSLDENRELAILTQDADVVKQLNATFAADWDSASTNKF